MLRQFSSGIIVYRLDSFKNRIYLLLQYHGKYWDLPKGKLEKTEKWIDAAIREVKEETNISSLCIEKDFEYTYSYIFNNHKEGQTEKTVTFFLGQADRNSKVLLSHEHIDYLWLSYRQARMQIYFKSVRCLLDKAEEFLIQKKVA